MGHLQFAWVAQVGAKLTIGKNHDEIPHFRIGPTLPPACLPNVHQTLLGVGPKFVEKIQSASFAMKRESRGLVWSNTEEIQKADKTACICWPLLAESGVWCTILKFYAVNPQVVVQQETIPLVSTRARYPVQPLQFLKSHISFLFQLRPRPPLPVAAHRHPPPEIRPPRHTHKRNRWGEARSAARDRPHAIFTLHHNRPRDSSEHTKVCGRWIPFCSPANWHLLINS